MSAARQRQLRAPARAECPGATFIDWDRLRDFTPASFRLRQPYPWWLFDAFLLPERHRDLRDALPSSDRFSWVAGRRRRYGQASHDRMLLKHEAGMRLPAPWRAFIDELQGDAYGRFVSGLLGTAGFRLGFQWHYTPTGCSVSPHCDADWKLGSQIFYFNSSADWDPAWGGGTVILDDGGRLAPRSAPEFDDFDGEVRTDCIGNRSLLFARTGRSWHGVRTLEAPPGRYRKVFIVEYHKNRPFNRTRSWLRV